MSRRVGSLGLGGALELDDDDVLSRSSLESAGFSGDERPEARDAIPDRVSVTAQLGEGVPSPRAADILVSAAFG